MKSRKLSAMFLVIAILMALIMPLTAQTRTISAQARRYQHTTHTYFQRHPYQKTGLVGAGAGAAVGAIFFGDRHHMGRNALRGAAIGGAAGLGYEYLKKHGKL